MKGEPDVYTIFVNAGFVRHATRTTGTRCIMWVRGVLRRPPSSGRRAGAVWLPARSGHSRVADQAQPRGNLNGLIDPGQQAFDAWLDANAKYDEHNRESSRTEPATVGRQPTAQLRHESGFTRPRQAAPRAERRRGGPLSDNERLAGLRIGASVEHALANGWRRARHRAGVCPETLRGGSVVGQVGPQQLDDHDSLESRIKRFPLDRVVADPQLTRELIALGDECNARKLHLN